MKNFFVFMIMIMLLFYGCGYGEVESSPYGDSGTFEGFVDEEMEFGTSFTSECEPGIPNIHVETDGGYEVGSLREEADAECEIVKADDHYTYLLDISVMAADEIENVKLAEGESVYKEEGNYAFTYIPLSNDYWCIVFAENKRDMSLLDHVKITESEMTKEEEGARKVKSGVTYRPSEDRD